ncbi:hypothetical protein [Synechocystis sp. PCC 7509]|uniref:hypothetical protein n=1 Tax=Synechocystis sp. PCC 7509 TaxID=927677 RepID=UPI0002AD05CA|nr:hypothetical protein [Synechocystis sp. PCC 7509]
MFAASTNFILSLESIGILLGILVSLTILLGLLIQYANKINRLEINIHHLRQELLEHSSLEGHKILLDRVVRTNDYTARIEKNLELHIQDYINRKETFQFLLGQINEKIDHKFKRLSSSIKDTQKFLKKHDGFTIRDSYEENNDDD